MYLAKLDGMDIPIPTPVARKEFYLAKLCGMDVPVPTPVTQDEMYLYALCGYTVDVPLPVTRLQVFMAAKLGMNVPTLAPVTREEYYWSQYEPTPPYVVETVTGTAPLLLTGAVAESIVSLTQYGKCEQRNLPQGFTELDYIHSAGDAYIDTGITLDEDDEVEVVFRPTDGTQTSRQIFGYRASASSQNVSLFMSGSNTFVCDFNNSGYADYRAIGGSPTTNKVFRAVLNKNLRAVYDGNTAVCSNSTACSDTISTGNVYIGYTGGSPSSTTMFIGDFLRVTIKGKANFVPAKRNSDNAVGMYNTVDWTFHASADDNAPFTAGSVAVPTPDAPVDIVCNNGKLEYGALGANLFDPSPSAILLNYYRNSTTGVLTPSNPNFISAGYIPVKPNTSYVLVGRAKSDNTISAWNRIYWFDADKEFISTCSYTQNTATVATSPANAAYAQYGINYNNSTANVVTQAEVDIYNYTFCEGTAEPATFVPYIGGVKAVGTPEVLTVSADGATDQTATVENLFAVGSYADTQEIIGGDITRKTWVVAFDGTENWAVYEGVFYVYTNDIGKRGAETGGAYAPFATRFKAVSSGFGDLQDGEIEYAGDTSLELVYSGAADLAAFKAKLAEWYAAGEPMIVVYPAPDRTETTTAQPLNTADGTNTVSVSANVSPITLTAEYMANE